MVFSKVRISRLFQGLGFVGFFKGSDLSVFLQDWFLRSFQKFRICWFFGSNPSPGWLNKLVRLV